MVLPCFLQNQNVQRYTSGLARYLWLSDVRAGANTGQSRPRSLAMVDLQRAARKKCRAPRSCFGQALRQF